LGVPSKRLSAVFVTVPAEALVGDFRRRYQPRAVARRLPPHITVLPPFRRELAADEALAADLAEHCAGFTPFAAELARIGTFERHVWLGPEPHERFVELLRATGRRFAALCGEGEDRERLPEPIPHLTIAEIVRGGDSRARVAERAREELSPHLPFAFEVADVALFEVRPEGWHEVRRFGLG
jgi:2'-5' RNA ligase